MIASLVLAVSVQFHGVMGQSARPDEKPLTFTGVTCLTEGPAGRVFFGGDDGRLYEVREGRPVDTGRKMPGCVLHWDGRVFRALGANDVWEIDPETLAFRHVLGTPKRRFDLAAVVPSDPKHPFARFGRYVTYDKARDALVALDDAGQETGVPFALAPRLQKSEICGLGFLPGGDLVAVSYYPDLRLYRYRADGTQVVGKGWSANRGFGSVRTSGGEAYHAGLDSLMRLADNLAGARENVYRVASGSAVRGYARQGDVECLATPQGLYVRRAGEDAFRRRFGGIGRLTALAVNGRHVYFSMGGTVRRMWLDADETGTFDLSDETCLRVNGSWTLKPLDFRNDGENLRVAAGAGGEWLFRAFPPPGHNTAKRYWTCPSRPRCLRHPSARRRRTSPSGRCGWSRCSSRSARRPARRRVFPPNGVARYRISITRCFAGDCWRTDRSSNVKVTKGAENSRGEQMGNYRIADARLAASFAAKDDYLVDFVRVYEIDR